MARPGVSPGATSTDPMRGRPSTDGRVVRAGESAEALADGRPERTCTPPLAGCVRANQAAPDPTTTPTYRSCRRFRRHPWADDPRLTSGDARGEVGGIQLDVFRCSSGRAGHTAERGGNDGIALPLAPTGRAEGSMTPAGNRRGRRRLSPPGVAGWRQRERGVVVHGMPAGLGNGGKASCGAFGGSAWPVGPVSGGLVGSSGAEGVRFLLPRTCARRWRPV